jgi:endonuclease/exonuclease/phosphatase (EEP) superfamily protein YafD
MLKFIFSASLLMTLNLSAHAEIESRSHPAHRYFKLIPENEAHSVMGLASARELKADSIKVFIWNIKKALLPNWKSEFETFGKNQDLILLQEAYRKELFNNTILAFSGIRWDMGTSFLNRKYNNQHTGTMIGSKVDPTEVIVKHTIDLEPVVATPKAMTFAKYPVDNRQEELLVISVHGINITSYASFKRHMAQAKNVIEDHHGPILFGGDFNTRTKRRTYYLMKLVKKLGLRPVEFKNGNSRMRWKFTRNYLDHSFVRGLSVKSAEVMPKASGSDHKPMLLEISVD